MTQERRDSLGGEQLPSREAPEAPRAPLRVLVVEDEADTADSFGRVLEMLGNRVHIARNGPDALFAGLEFRPDVVLLDIGLPFMNGYEVARKMRERFWGRHVLIVATTAWDQDEDKRRSVEAGIDHYLVKPIDPHALARLIATVRSPG